ncbi:hypothetical protein V6N13_068931 [Hibiscus sabdariffa]
MKSTHHVRDLNLCSVAYLLVLMHLSWSFSSGELLCSDLKTPFLLTAGNGMILVTPGQSLGTKALVGCCSWQGVECDNLAGLVIGIDLSRRCLAGYLHANNTTFSCLRRPADSFTCKLSVKITSLIIRPYLTINGSQLITDYIN